MKIIHTSDVHLSSGKKERLEAFKGLLSKAGDKKADLLIISGDLFDSNEEADILRPGLRKLLSSLSFRIYAIPGNHDRDAYRADMNFGGSIEILNRLPFEVTDHDGIRIIYVPYADQVFNDLAAPLKENINKEKINILVMHCSLDIPYLGEDEYGDEKRQAYLPVNSKVLGDIGFDYVFAGHFHSRSVESRLSDKTLFFYSGSPVSISRKEKGRRSAVFLDTDRPVKERISLLELDSFYYDEFRIELEPGKEGEGLDSLESMLKTYTGHNAEIDAVIGGFISSGEKDMAGRIKEVTGTHAGGGVIINTLEEYRDITSVLQDPLYTAFRERLDKAELDEVLKEDIDQMVKTQFSRIKAR